MAAANREAAGTRGPPGAAKRGRLSEREWADVVRGMRVVRQEGVALKMHGVDIIPTRLLKQQKVKGYRATPGQQKKQTESVALKPPPAASGETPPPSVSKRSERSRQRLLEFQEKKRAAAVQEEVAKGCDLAVAQAKVARRERKRLEERMKARAAPMEEDAASIDGRPTGEGGQPRGEHASPKRARVVRYFTGEGVEGMFSGGPSVDTSAATARVRACGGSGL